MAFFSHPDRLMFPAVGLRKRDIGKYYRDVHVPLLAFVRGHIAYVKRYPHGLDQNGFFQKNLPQYAPDWIPSVVLGKWKKVRYTVIDSLRTLLWWLNQDVLEFHLVPLRSPDFQHPRYMAFDIDPPEGMPFKEIRDFTIAIRPIIESFGYNAFVKPSGKRGAHVLCPLEARWSAEKVFEAAKEVGEVIVQRWPNTSINPKKGRHQGNILIDLMRNYPFQSVVMPWSTRAVAQATVSVPMRWEDFAQMESPEQFTVHTASRWIAQHDNAWATFDAAASYLHTDKS